MIVVGGSSKEIDLLGLLVIVWQLDLVEKFSRCQKTSKLQAHFWAADLAAPMHFGYSFEVQ